MKKIPIIIVTAANPYEMGIQYGTQARSWILKARDYYREMFERKKENWSKVQKCSMDFFKEVEAAYPEQAQEVEGIAAGAGVSVEDIMSINSRYEISKFPKLPECTTGAVLPEAAENGHTLAFKNWDLNIQVREHIVFLVIRQPDFWMAGFTEAGQMIRDGINSYGISLVSNNLQSTEDHYGLGIPVTFLRRRILYSKTFQEAEQVLLNSKRTISNNIMLIDCRNGMARDYEWYPSGADILEPEAGVLTHANHFVKCPERDALTGRPRNRDARLRELMMVHHGHITVGHIKAALRDHKYYPLSICGHPGDPKDPYTKDRATVSSMIVDFRANEIYACIGSPCEEDYTLIHPKKEEL
ncbi:MAG: acyl-CoA--6-aminopenicillanic acid acyltransferase [Hungatella sp.]|nr:acyl-CoA--6-aminopenicillanic acid acyltransferase [Hungatella sp.]